MTEEIKNAFKRRIKHYEEVVQSDNSNTNERIRAAYSTNGIVELYADIAGISYDEAANILHKAGRNED